MLPELLHKQAQQLLNKFCRERIPCARFQGRRLGYSFADNHVTLFQECPAATGGEDWLRRPIARFAYTPELNQWALFSIDAQLHWHLYLNVNPSLNLGRLIEALNEDPTGIFWT
jgi:hypothetical protein